MKLEWLPQALIDFNEIVDFIADDNPVAAVGQGDEIERQITMLLDNLSNFSFSPSLPIPFIGSLQIFR